MICYGGWFVWIGLGFSCFCLFWLCLVLCCFSVFVLLFDDFGLFGLGGMVCCLIGCVVGLVCLLM